MAQWDKRLIESLTLLLRDAQWISMAQLRVFSPNRTCSESRVQFQFHVVCGDCTQVIYLVCDEAGCGVLESKVNGHGDGHEWVTVEREETDFNNQIESSWCSVDVYFDTWGRQ